MKTQKISSQIWKSISTYIPSLNYLLIFICYQVNFVLFYINRPGAEPTKWYFDSRKGHITLADFWSLQCFLFQKWLIKSTRSPALGLFRCITHYCIHLYTLTSCNHFASFHALLNRRYIVNMNISELHKLYRFLKKDLKLDFWCFYWVISEISYCKRYIPLTGVILIHQPRSIITSTNINLFQPSVALLYPWKHQKTWRFSDVSEGITMQHWA